MKIYKWIYKVVKKDNESEIKENFWITALNATEICSLFESFGWEVVYLSRICETGEAVSDWETDYLKTLVQASEKIEEVIYAG